MKHPEVRGDKVGYVLDGIVFRKDVGEGEVLSSKVCPHHCTLIPENLTHELKGPDLGESEVSL